MIREVAEYDPQRAETVFDWPLRDLFLAYVARLKERARLQYYVDYLVWASLAPYMKRAEKPPAVPRILKGV